jgi:hypothetical protein
MELKNGYKLVYEVVDTENGVREFRASKTGVPAADDLVIASNKIGTNKLIYEYEGNFYGTGDKAVPTYNENGTPADTCLTDSENFAKVFVDAEDVDSTNADDESESGTQEATQTTDTEPVTTEGDENVPESDPEDKPEDEPDTEG